MEQKSFCLRFYTYSITLLTGSAVDKVRVPLFKTLWAVVECPFPLITGEKRLVFLSFPHRDIWSIVNLVQRYSRHSMIHSITVTTQPIAISCVLLVISNQQTNKWTNGPTDGPTGQPTNQPKDQQTKQLIELCARN